MVIYLMNDRFIKNDRSYSTEKNFFLLNTIWMYFIKYKVYLLYCISVLDGKNFLSGNILFLSIYQVLADNYAALKICS